jgi:hypothetical protein
MLFYGASKAESIICRQHAIFHRAIQAEMMMTKNELV